MEKKRRETVFISSEVRRMDKKFDSLGEKECVNCFYDLHLSAVGCLCSYDRFSCLNHADKLCLCEPSRRFYLFRYDLNQLNTLVEALEGDFNASQKWLGGLDSNEDVSPTMLEDNSQSMITENKVASESPRPVIDVNSMDADIPSEKNHPSQVLETCHIGSERSDSHSPGERKAIDLNELYDSKSNYIPEDSKPSCQDKKYISESLAKFEEETSDIAEVVNKQNHVNTSKIHSSIIEEKVTTEYDYSNTESKEFASNLRRDKAPMEYVTSMKPGFMIKPKFAHDFLGSQNQPESDSANSTRNSDGASCSRTFEEFSDKYNRSMLLDLNLAFETSSQPLFNNPDKGACTMEWVWMARFTEILKIGIAMPGKSWCNSKTIFPNGKACSIFLHFLFNLFL